MFRFLLILSCVLGLCLPLTVQAGAKEAVEQLLAKRSVTPGYDEVRKAFVVIVNDQKKISDPSRSLLFQKTRSQMARGLALDGKCEIMRALSQRLKAVDTVGTQTEGDKSANAMSSRLLVAAKARLKGCRVLCSAEDWDAQTGVYTMAMAVVWSAKLERAVAVPIAASDGEWKNWLSALNLSCVVGGRQFTDAKDHRFYCGIGCVDIQGLRGARYQRAVVAAEDAARENLIYELFSDVATVEALEQNTSEVERLETTAEKFSLGFKSQIDAKCQRNGVRTKKVHSAVVRHPVSGREMYVSVVTVLE